MGVAVRIPQLVGYGIQEQVAPCTQIKVGLRTEVEMNIHFIMQCIHLLYTLADQWSSNSSIVPGRFGSIEN